MITNKENNQEEELSQDSVNNIQPPPEQKEDIGETIAENSPLKNLSLQQGSIIETDPEDPYGFKEQKEEEAIINKEKQESKELFENAAFDDNGGWTSYSDFDINKYSEKGKNHFDIAFKFAKENGDFDNEEDFYNRVISDPEKRKLFHQDMTKVYGDIPPFKEFSKSLLLDNIDEEPKEIVSFSRTDEKLQKDVDGTYQRYLEESPERAEQYWEDKMSFNNDARSLAYFRNKESEKYEKYKDETGGSYTSMVMGEYKSMADELLPVDKIEMFNKRLPLIEATERANEYINKYGKLPEGGEIEGKLNQARKNFEEAIYNNSAENDEWAATVKNADDMLKNNGLMTVDSYVQLLKKDNEDGSAVMKASALLDKYGSASATFKPSEEELEDIQSIIKSSKESILKESYNPAFEFTPEDYDKASESSPMTGVSSDMNPAYSTLPPQEKFMMTYKISYDELQRLEKLVDYDEQSVFEVAGRELDGTDNEDINSKIKELRSYLRNSSELYLLNNNTLNFDAGSNLPMNMLTSTTQAFSDVISDAQFVNSDKDVLSRVIAENPSMANQEGSFNETAEYYYGTRGKEGDKEYVDKGRFLTDPTLYTDVIANSGVLALELMGGSALLGGLSRSTKYGRALSKLSNASFLKLNRTLKIAEKTGKLNKFGIVGKLYKYNPKLAYHAVQATKSGLNYQAAGLAFNNSDDLNIITGTLGYGGSFLGGKIGNAINKKMTAVIPRVSGIFGKDGQNVLRGVADLGKKINLNQQYKRLGTGFSEVFEEEGQNLASIVLNTDSFDGFYKEFASKYGDLGQAGKNMLVSYMMGFSLGGTALGESFISKLDSDLAKFDNLTTDIRFDSRKVSKDVFDARKIKKFKEDAERVQAEIVEDIAAEEGIVMEQKGESESELKSLSEKGDVSKERIEDAKKETEKELDKDAEKYIAENDRVLGEAIQETIDKATSSKEIAEQNNSNEVQVDATNAKDKVEEGREVKASSPQKLLNTLTEVQESFSNGTPISTAIEEASNKTGVPLREARDFIYENVNPKETSEEFEQFKSEVQEAREEGTPIDYLGQEVVRTTPRGVEEVGKLRTKGDDVFFVRGTKGNKEAVKIGTVKDASNKGLGEFNISRTSKSGVVAKDVSKIDRQKAEIVESKYFNERKSFDNFSEKINSLKEEKRKGNITEEAYNNSTFKALETLKKSVPDIASKVETDTDLKSFNDALISSRNRALDASFKATEKARKPFITETIKKEKKAISEDKKQLKGNIKELKEKQKELKEQKEKEVADLKKKESEVKQAEQKLINAEGTAIDAKYKEDGVKYSPSEIKAKAISAKDLSEAMEWMTGLRAYDIDQEFVLGLSSVFNDLNSSILIAEMANNILSNRGVLPNGETSSQLELDKKNVGQIYSIVGSKYLRVLITGVTRVVSPKDYKEKANKVMDSIGLGDILNSRFSELSDNFSENENEFSTIELKASKIADRFLKNFKKYDKGNKESSDLLYRVNDYLKGLESEENIPVELRADLKDMIEMTRGLHSLIVDAGLAKESALLQMQEDGSFYLSTTYLKFFPDSKWHEKVREKLNNGEFNDVRDLIRSQYQESNNLDFNEKDASQQDKVVDDTIIGLAMNPNELTQVRGVGKSPISPSHKSLKTKKEIDERIKAIFGEVKDPSFNFVNTVGNQAAILRNHKNRMDLMDYGLKNGLIEEMSNSNFNSGNAQSERLANEMIPLPKSTQQFLGEGNYLIDKSLNAALQAYNTPAENKWKWWGVASSLIKQANTIYSPSSHIRNIMGATSTSLSMGHINGLTIPAMKIFLDIGTNDAGFKDALTILGVTDAGMAQEVFKIMKDTKEGKNIQSLIEDGKTETAMSSLIAEIGKAFRDTPRKVYQATDNLARVNGFINFLSNQAAIYGADPSSEYNKITKGEGSMLDVFSNSSKMEKLIEWSKTNEGQKAMRFSARETDMYYPTYRKLPRALRYINENIPFAGTFTSFPAEALRTGYNMYAGGLTKIKYAYSKDNDFTPAQKRIMAWQGVRQIMFAAGTQAAIFALGKMSAEAVGLSEEEEESVRTSISEYDRDSNLYYYLSGEGQLSYVNLDVFNTYAYPKEVLNKILDGEAYNALSTLLEPVTSKHMLYQLGETILTGKDSRGRLISNPYDSFLERGVEKAGYLLRRNTGGIGRYVGTIYDSNISENAEDKKDYSGDVIDPLSQKSIARLFGVTSSRVQPRSPRFSNEDREAFDRISMDVYKLKGNEISDSNLTSVNKGTQDFFNKARDLYKSTMILSKFSENISSDEASESLRKSLSYGKYPMKRNDWRMAVENGIDMEWKVQSDGTIKLTKKQD